MTIRLMSGLFGAAVMITGSLLRAQATPAASPSLPWQTHTDSSAILGEKRTIRVVTPAGYATGTRRYPVLILLDANDEPQFRAATANVAFLATRNAIPPMLIVGVENGRDRARDLTPESSSDGATQMGGGGPQFIAYLEREVLPMVREKYRAAPYTVFAGHSLGGLMGVYVAAAHPGLAQAVIAMSPSLWINKEQATPRWVKEIAARSAPLRLFTTRGAFEPTIDLSTARFADALTRAVRTRPNAALAHRHVRYDDDTHGLTPLGSLTDGLRWVFADYSVAVTGFDKLADPFTADSAALVGAVRESEAIFARSYRAFPPAMVGGDSIPTGFLHAGEYTGLAGAFTMLKQPGAGIATFTRALQAYPDNPRLHRALANMRLLRGDTATAIADLEKALSLSTTPATAGLKTQLETQLAALRKAGGGS